MRLEPSSVVNKPVTCSCHLLNKVAIVVTMKDPLPQASGSVNVCVPLSHTLPHSCSLTTELGKLEHSRPSWEIWVLLQLHHKAFGPQTHLCCILGCGSLV
jgi:flagellar motor switch protein FliM